MNVRRWVLIAGLGALGVGAVVTGYLLQVADKPAAAAEPTALTKAWKWCGQVGQLADGDKTLVLDMKGEWESDGVSVSDVNCFLVELKVPAWVKAEMYETRALDGRQSQSWAGFEASWSYHPKTGLDIIIRQIEVGAAVKVFPVLL